MHRISFSKCLAREGVLLSTHLIRTKKKVTQFVSGLDETSVFLLGLSGLCHDIGKAHVDWQRYIRSPEKQKGPTHSGFGAFIFSYVAYHWLRMQQNWEMYKKEWFYLTRDIADHHSSLKSIQNDSWNKCYSYEKYDLKGMSLFFQHMYEGLSFLPFQQSALEEWVFTVPMYIEEATDLLSLGWETDGKLPKLMDELQLRRKYTTALIASDRFDVTEVQNITMSKDVSISYQKKLHFMCQQKKSSLLATIRQKARQAAWKKFKGNEKETFFALEMPTGYGKTFTAYQMALHLVKQNDKKKIIYVAPYISVLEQTSMAIREALKVPILEHYSLAFLQEEEEFRSQIVLESWAHPFVSTSFHQFWKAIFPKKAQETLRRSFLQDSIVLIDEPQIMDPSVWNLFLYGLESLAKQLRLQVIFLTATMPVFQFGLKKQPFSIKVPVYHDVSRYTIQKAGPFCEKTLVSFVKQQERQSQAIILNTIKDAKLVYRELDVEKKFLLFGQMLPIHKQIRIQEIREALKKKQTVHVVATQVVEAGLDISFMNVYRASTILPSIFQVAGRCNRHGETEEIGNVVIFDFLRNGETNTRTTIYPASLCQLTDYFLQKQECWTETTFHEYVPAYYNKMFAQNTYEKYLK